MVTKVILIFALLTVIIVLSLLSLRHRKLKHEVTSYIGVVSLFDPKNINSIEFIRNKIVVSFKDITTFKVDLLKKFGGQGINIVGDKVKFFVSDDVENNKKLYNELVEFIER
jgi:hypothetical protein